MPSSAQPVSLWQRLRNLWPGAFRQQVTRTGMVYAVSTVLVSTIAFISANNLMFLVSAAMIAILGVSGFVSKLGLAGLEIDILLPDHISARRKVRGGVRLRNLKRWFTSFSIQFQGTPGSGVDTSVYFPVVPGGATAQEPVDLYFPSRGRYTERTFELRTRFPFGFADRRESVTIHHEIIVYPCLDPQNGFDELLGSISGELESQQRGRGYDFHRIRPYETSESVRHLDWKATAHTGSLQVREFTRDEDQRVLIYLDLNCAPEQSAWFEAAVDCSAFLTYRLNLRGARVRFRTAEFDISLPHEGDIHTILNYLALVTPRNSSRVGESESPDDEGCVHIVLTADPARLAQQGGRAGENARVLGPTTFSQNDAR
ncbi:MAG: DUF58 domain-containing protein [Bryobacteraceae bacterium]